MCYNRKKPRAGISKQQFNDQVVRKAMIKYLLDDVAPESEIAPSTDASALASNTPADEKVRRLGSSAVQPRDEGVFLDKPMEEMAQLKRHLSPKKANPQGFAGLGAGLALDAIPSLVPTQAVQTNGQRAVLSRKSTNSPWSFEAQKRAIDAQYNRMFAPSPPSEAPKPRLLRHPIVENAMDLGIELFKTRFWDPEDKDFSIEVFWNKIKSIYMCPYPTCDNKSKTQDEFVAHLKKPHTLRRVRCPACAKSFPTCSALIGHCESTSARCRIRHSRMLKEVMDSYSGGILSVKDKPSFRDEQWGDALRVHSMHDILERERQDPARHLRGGDEVTLQAQQPQIYW